MKKILVALFLLGAGFYSEGQVTFQKTYGGTGLEYGAFVQQTTDGGFIVTGTTESFGSSNDRDIYLVKTDTYGDTLWTKTFGTTAHLEHGLSVRQTIDGGYIIIGLDIFIKTDANGDTIWTKTYGPQSDVYATMVQQTNDGGYLISGYIDNSITNSDVLLARTDSSGNILWSKCYGGNLDDVGTAQQTSDSGYIITFTTYSPVNLDIGLIKTDVNGNIIWTKTYGGTGDDLGSPAQQTIDGGYIITGSTNSFGAGDADVYLIKTDANGNLIWSKTFGGTGYDSGSRIQQTTDGGYIIAGFTDSFGAGFSDVYLVKTDLNGDTLWTRTFGGPSNETGLFVQQTSDGGYIVGAGTIGFGAGSQDIYLIRTDSLGNSGCYQGYTATIVTSSPTIVTMPATPVSPSSLVVIPTLAIIAGNGGVVTTLCTTVGINEISNFKFPISISPNPSTDIFTITFPQPLTPKGGQTNKGSVEIFNVLGEKIYNEKINGENKKEIRLKNITAGVYLVNVRDAEKQYTQKLIIQ